MGTIRPATPAALVAAILYADDEAAGRAVDDLTARWGPLEAASERFAFTQTGYYEPEMGPELVKFFCCFKRPVDPGDLADIKLATDAIERELAIEREGTMRRRVNIDPGYVTPAKLVLASTKDFSHRVCLGGGIYGEVTLRSTGGRLEPIDTTFPDYATPLALDFFNGVRRFAKRSRTEWTRPPA